MARPGLEPGTPRFSDESSLAIGPRPLSSQPALPSVRPMLHVHRAERADGLVEALRALLADPSPDPVAPEVIAVPTRGMERWLAQRMSDRLGAGDGRRDGVCA